MVSIEVGHTKYTDAEAISAIEVGDVSHVQFPATQSASADANALDDYEEGTWTPTIQDDSLSDAESQTYSVQLGSFTKIGRIVHCTGRVTLTSIGTLTGTQQARLAGFPFTVANVTNKFPSLHIGFAGGLAITALEHVSGICNSNTTHALLYGWDLTVGVNILTITEMSADGDLIFSFSFEV